MQPGHGTATLGFLAGANVTLTLPWSEYRGYLGGAPQAEIVPVRISPTVVHLFTSTMAKGLYYALAPSGDPADPDPTNRCDVVSLSHGGLPTPVWADAVNLLYDNGITVCASSGDSFYLKLFDLATHFTVYPSAFNRVVTVVGATYTHEPYITADFGEMQGCWGPRSVMEKAIAGYTPNVAWMQYNNKPRPYDMSGGGTSMSTPQVAAACALWLQLYRDQLPANWRRVEACRVAMFSSAYDKRRDEEKLGWGMLRVPAMLDSKLASSVIRKALSGKLKQSPRDTASYLTWVLLFLRLGPTGSAAEQMYETEVAQTVLSSRNRELRAAVHEHPSRTRVSAKKARRYRDLLSEEPISNALRQRILV